MVYFCISILIVVPSPKIVDLSICNHLIYKILRGSHIIAYTNSSCSEIGNMMFGTSEEHIWIWGRIVRLM